MVIVVGIDGSACANRALAFAEEEARVRAHHAPCPLVIVPAPER